MPELGYRAELARGAADEYRRVVTGTLAGLIDPATVKRILAPSWTGRRFWLE